ncbi:MAG: hypothetical protein ABII72_04500 [Parcubacteria group bacterium]
MKNQLERVFSSKTRIKLLTLFLRNPDQPFYVRELTRKLKERINSIRRELENLSKMGLLINQRKNFKRYYQVNKSFYLLKEFQALFLKGAATSKERLADRLKKTGQIKYACLSGAFTKSPARVDFFIVGDVKKNKLVPIIKELEKEQGQEINYTVMPTSEFDYRLELGDRFLLSVINNEKIELLGSLDGGSTGSP